MVLSLSFLISPRNTLTYVWLCNGWKGNQSVLSQGCEGILRAWFIHCHIPGISRDETKYRSILVYINLSLSCQGKTGLIFAPGYKVRLIKRQMAQNYLPSKVSRTKHVYQQFAVLKMLVDIVTTTTVHLTFALSKHILFQVLQLW